MRRMGAYFVKLLNRTRKSWFWGLSNGVLGASVTDLAGKERG